MGGPSRLSKRRPARGSDAGFNTRARGSATPPRLEPGETDHFSAFRESFIAPCGVPGANGEVTVPGGTMSPALAKAMTAAVCRSSFHTRLESITNTLLPPFAAGGPGRTNRALAAAPPLPTVAQSSGARRRHDSPGHRADETEMHFGVDSNSQGRPDLARRAAHPAAAMAAEADRGRVRRAVAERTGPSRGAAAPAAARQWRLLGMSGNQGDKAASESTRRAWPFNEIGWAGKFLSRRA